MRLIMLATAWACISFGLTGAFAWCLSSTLDDMTRADCRAGVTAACKALQQR